MIDARADTEGFVTIDGWLQVGKEIHLPNEARFDPDDEHDAVVHAMPPIRFPPNATMEQVTGALYAHWDELAVLWGHALGNIVDVVLGEDFLLIEVEPNDEEWERGVANWEAARSRGR